MICTFFSQNFTVQIYALFRKPFETEKQNPQTYSLFVCNMYGLMVMNRHWWYVTMILWYIPYIWFSHMKLRGQGETRSSSGCEHKPLSAPLAPFMLPAFNFHHHHQYHYQRHQHQHCWQHHHQYQHNHHMIGGRVNLQRNVLHSACDQGNLNG